MRSLVNLLRMFQLDMRRQYNERQALAPGSIHPRTHASSITMTIGALMALTGFMFHPILTPIGVVVFGAVLLIVVGQAIADVIRSH